MKILNRAKSFYSDEYFISQDIKFELEMMYLRVNGVWRECEESTRSVNLDDMLDSQGNKIFASLNIKGGSLIEYEGTIYEVMYLNYLIQGVTNMHSIKSELFEYTKLIGIQK